MARKESLERPSPLPLNRAERSGFRRRVLCVLTLLALAEVRSGHAACVPTGTSHGDTIVCSGSQTEGVAAKAGNDSISILPGASITLVTPQSATAIDAGSGNDSVVNDGRVSVTVAPVPLAPAGKSAACSGSRDDSYDKSTFQAIGIAGGGGNDLVNNRGTIAVQTTAAGGTQPPQCDSSYSDKTTKHDDDDGHRPVKPVAVSIGILGDNGNDQINNGGSITVSASSAANSPQVTAKGIVGANGDDVIVNTGTITVTASSTAAASAPPGAPTLPSSKESHGSKRLDISEAGSVTAVGIEGGNGKDVLRNENVLTVNASATSSSITPSLTLTGGNEVTATTTLETRAVGITGGAGKDEISNSGALTVNATSEVSGVNVKVSLIDLAHSDTSTFVRSSATGIDAGSGKDSITVANTGTLTANATSKSSGVNVNLSLVAAATAESKVEVQATAAGIVGGQGKNTIDIGGAVKATATSQESDVGVAVNYADLTILDRQGSDASTTVESKATGIDGSKGENRISIAKTGSVEAVANSKLSSLSVSVGMEGVPQNTETLINDHSLVSGGITSNSTATGIVGGGHGDYLTNAGSVTANATSSATQNTVNIGISLFEITVPTPNIGLAGAGTEANAAATGIASGGGGDTILNSGLVKSDATASATANAFAISLGVLSVNLIPGAPTIPLGATLIVADTATTASAQSTGIAGGAGDDTIRNTGAVETHAKASAVSLAVSGSVDIEKEKGEMLFTVDAVAARAGTEATSHAVGIDGGAGRNQVYNDGSVTVGSAANATAVGVAVNVVGNLKGSGAILGLAATDTSGIATSDATGIRGGSDHDRISNTGSVAVTSNADVTSASVSLTATVAKGGLVAGVALARAESIATASATGIDGAGGRDEIESTGTIAATAKANAAAIGVSVAVAGTKQGVAGSAALTDTTTTATATAIGIRGGGAAEADDRDRHDEDRYTKHDDGKNGRISNANIINADAQARALSVSASVNAAIAKGGLVVGAALARAESIATASATGIDGAGGSGEIENTGTITAKATANADAVGVSVSVAGTKQGVAGSAALTDTSTTATATAIGIRSGAAAEDRDKDRHDGHDDKGSDGHGNDKDGDRYDKHDDSKNGPITNAKAISAEAQANALSVSASANVSIAKEGVALGAALADTSTHAVAVAKGIEADSGENEVNNDGTIAVKAGASGQAVSVALTVEGTATGLAAGAALVDASVHAASTAIGVDGAAGDDRITNRGAINIESAGSTATAVGVGVSALIAKEGAALGAALADTSATAVTVATGIDGGAGNDVLANLGTIAAKNVTANADAVAVSLAVALSKEGVGAGAALAKSDSTARATATGLDGGSGNDELLNQGGITLQGVKADATAVSVSLAIAGAKDGLALSAALVDADATATATAIGMAGGAGNDKLSNLGAIVASDIKADATAVGVSVSATFSQNGAVVAAALAETGTTASATAKGLDGGAGNDSLTNAGSVTLQQVKADAGAVSVSVGLSGAEAGVTIAAGLADASGKAFATATGLDGGTGDDTLVNNSKGKIAAEDIGASAHAAGISVALSGSSVGLSAGAALADTSGTATSTAKGMDGGTGNDALVNEKGGEIALRRTTADADSTSVSVSISASLGAGVAAGAALSRAGATANATATGMDGGADHDQILNRGSITLDGVTANAKATGVSVQLGVANAGVAIGAALADTRSTATATAKGLDGGAGNDWLKNEGQITLQNVKSDARATSVGVTMNAAIDAGVAVGVALTDARSTAEVAATGMDGGAGNDALYNVGSIKIQDVEADAHATGVSVTVSASLAGIAAGAALADTSATARAVVKGMDGGTGDDFIQNKGSIDVQGKAKVDATSVAINVSGSIGVAGGVEMTHASTTAQATVIGIDGGSGHDEVANEGGITAKAEAESKAAAISVGISVGVGGDATLADAKSNAAATAIGINMDDASAGTVVSAQAAKADGDHGSKDDHRNTTNVIRNSGALTVSATSTSTGTSISGNLFGLALGDTTNTSTAEAIGIRTGDTKDQIWNTGAISAASSATATGLSVSVTLGGKAMGDASTTAQAIATGIETRGGDDIVDNAGTIKAEATSHASANSVSVGLVGSARANASTTSLAAATAIDGGAGDDQLTNRGGISAIATATASADGTRVNIFGVSNGDVSTKPTATATGISGGDGNDTLVQLGTLNVVASSSTSVSSASWQIGGSAGSSAGATASAFATGLDGGAGNDQILNRGTSLTVSADAAATANSASWTLAGVAGDSAALLASAHATGIGGGAGADYVRNETALGAAAHATLSATGGSDAIFGGASSDTKIGAEAFATGIDAGTGDNRVENLGAVTVTAAASVTSDKTSFSFAGSASIGDLLAARSSASGIIAGSGNDSIDNTSQIFVSANSVATATNGADAALGGDTHASGSANAAALASGIDAGGGNNRVDNRGALTVGAGVTSTSNNDSSAGFFFSSGGVIADAVGTVRATGIGTGNGDSALLNRGNLDIGATASVTTNAHAEGGDISLFGAFGGNATASATSRASADVAGIRAGDGNHSVYNDGAVNVTLKLDASAFTDPNSGTVGGSGTGFSTASAGDPSPSGAARAAGIVVGNGNSLIGNTGTLSINANATTFAGTDSDGTSFGRSDGFVTADAAIIAAGVQAGEGDHLIASSGTITVSSNTKTTASVSTDAGSLGGGSSTLGLSRSSAFSIGIGAGNGANQISNDGTMTVGANASSDSGVSAHGGAGAHPTSNAQSFATADASGIQAGGGNNLIVNTGTATVTATAAATGGSFVDRSSCTACGGDNTSLGDSIATARAAGIRAGDGNNTIRNEGTLKVGAGALASLNWDGDGDDNHRVAFAKAEAIGIDAGNGNNVIVNRGTITVSAFALASVNGGLSPSSVTAIGIRTGNGNDTVVNAGTITATRSDVFGLPVPGTAISTGGGDDTVTLKAGSVTNGNIDLGTGNNRLVLEGTPVVNGSIVDGSSSLALVFNSAGSFAGALPGLSATKNGPGTFTLSALAKMQRIEVNQGTLKLDNDYTFMSGGTFQAKIGADGTYGQFYVNGRAALDGTMKIVRGSGAYVNGTTYDVLVASNGIQSGTAFSRVELPDDTRLLKFRVEQLSDSVLVKADVASFTTVAGTPNQMAVARNLDRILPRTSGTLNQLLGNIQVMPDAQFASAFSSMSPAVYAGYTASTFNSVQQYTNVLQDRMTALRAGDFSPAQTAGASGGEPIRLAYAGKGLSDLLDAREAERALSSGLWLRAFSQKGDQNATDGMSNGYDYRLTGTAIGYDRRLTNSFSVGASLGTVKNKVNVDSNVSQSDVDSTMGTIYAGYFDRQLYVNGMLSAGRNKYDTRRTNTVDQSTISSSHDGEVLAATLGAGRYVQLAAWWVEPFASVQYTRLKEKAFSETGSGALDLPARTSDGLVSALGVRFSLPITDGNGASWIPQASLAWLHDYSKNQVINASYIGAPDSSFSIDGQPVQRNGALLGLGISYRTKGGITSTLQYNGEFRDQFRAHGFAGEFRFEF